MNLEEFNAPFPGKIQGTWNLHDLLPKDMNFFIILSSLGGMHGASAQGNYAAACSFQDAFARYRHSLGLPCTSLDLGVVATVGYLAERFDAAQNWTLSFTGHDSLDEGELHHVMEVACALPIPQTSSPWNTQSLVAVTTPAQVRRCGVLEEHAWMQKPLCRHLYQIDKEPVGNARKAGSKTSFAGQLRDTTSKEEAAEVIVKAVIQRLSRSLSVPEEDIDPQKPAHAYGVDSLVAVELQFWFKNEMKADLTVLQILGGTSILELGATAADKSDFC
jgi:acyl carrier protein